MKTLFFLITLTLVYSPFSWSITGALSFGVISKTCRVQLITKQQRGQFKVQKTFKANECKTAIELCEELAAKEQKGICQITTQQVETIPSVEKPLVAAKRCASYKRCGRSPVYSGGNISSYMRYRKCVRRIDTCLEEGGVLPDSD